MITLLQRVSQAGVTVNNEVVAKIAQGLLIFVGVQADDTHKTAELFVRRLVNYRVFSDQNGKMNLSLLDINGGLLLVPQFTLAATTTKGRRPSFTSAASPQHAREIFEAMIIIARGCHASVETGHFGADMKVQLVNDGPVTFILD